jgi:hypothetical protein
VVNYMNNKRRLLSATSGFYPIAAAASDCLHSGAR